MTGVRLFDSYYLMKKIFAFLSLLAMFPLNAFAEGYSQKEIVFDHGVGYLSIQGHNIQIKNVQYSGLYQVRCFYHEIDDKIHIDSYIVLKSHSLGG